MSKKAKKTNVNIAICLPGTQRTITREEFHQEEVIEEVEGEQDGGADYACDPIQAVTAELGEIRKMLEQQSQEIAGLRRQVQQRPS